MGDHAKTTGQGLHRILSLDGGGTWALLQVLTLIELFGAAATGHDVLRRFDLAVSNSGGSIVLGALAVDLRLSELLELFLTEAQRTSVFQATPFEHFVEVIGHGKLPLPRYSTKKKYDALAEKLGRPAKELLVDWGRANGTLASLLFMGFDYDVERASFFRTYASKAASRTSGTPGMRLLDAVHASANPPVLYFDEPTQVQDSAGEYRFWDGAIGGYNNPAMAAVVEALANGVAPSSVRVLAIGTGTVHRPRRPANEPATDARFMGGENPGILSNLRKLAGAVLDDPPDAASFVAHVSLGGEVPSGNEVVTDGPLVRMNPVVRPVMQDGAWTWPNAFRPNDWVRLTHLELDTLMQSDIELIHSLGLAWIRGDVCNQPIRAGTDLTAEIGHNTFAEAHAAAGKWLKV
jgi:uncharacterized protein